MTDTVTCVTLAYVQVVEYKSEMSNISVLISDKAIEAQSGSSSLVPLTWKMRWTISQQVKEENFHTKAPRHEGGNCERIAHRSILRKPSLCLRAFVRDLELQG
jgi:hypothetical protein